MDMTSTAVYNIHVGESELSVQMGDECDEHYLNRFGMFSHCDRRTWDGI